MSLALPKIASQYIKIDFQQAQRSIKVLSIIIHSARINLPLVPQFGVFVRYTDYFSAPSIIILQTEQQSVLMQVAYIPIFLEHPNTPFRIADDLSSADTSVLY